MEMRYQDTFENFIRERRDEFEIEIPPEGHSERFMKKLNERIRHIISIVPYLIRVAIATVLIFTGSIIVWNNFIRKDRHEITLKNKISLAFDRIKKI